jgi:hypothetical protein
MTNSRGGLHKGYGCAPNIGQLTDVFTRNLHQYLSAWPGQLNWLALREIEDKVSGCERLDLTATLIIECKTPAASHGKQLELCVLSRGSGILFSIRSNSGGLRENSIMRAKQRHHGQ